MHWSQWKVKMSVLVWEFGSLRSWIVFFLLFVKVEIDSKAKNFIFIVTKITFGCCDFEKDCVLKLPPLICWYHSETNRKMHDEKNTNKQKNCSHRNRMEQRQWMSSYSRLGSTVETIKIYYNSGWFAFVYKYIYLWLGNEHFCGTHFSLEFRFACKIVETYEIMTN